MADTNTSSKWVLVLKSCPFCGGEAMTAAKVVRGVASDSIRFKVYCRKCGIEKYEDVQSHCSFETVEKTKQKVIEAWNERVKNVD